MTVLFITILNMSITASVVALAVMLVRLPLKKAPKIFSYALWAVVLFRLVVPFSIESIFSLMPASVNAIPQDIVVSQNPSIQTGIQFFDMLIIVDYGNIANYENIAASGNTVNPISTALNIAGYVWFVGFTALLLYAAIGYATLKRRVRYATLVRDNIFETDKIQTPFVLGFIRPKIYFPLTIDPRQQDYILKHEQTHIKRCDYLIKPIAFAVLALHWFNPLIWISYILMSKDMEMSCDEAVLRKSDDDIRGVYSSSLLNLAVKRTALLNPIAFGESNVNERVLNVLSFKKPKVWVTVVSAAVVLLFLVGFASNRVVSANVLSELAYYHINEQNIQSRSLAPVPATPNFTPPPAGPGNMMRSFTEGGEEVFREFGINEGHGVTTRGGNIYYYGELVRRIVFYAHYEGGGWFVFWSDDSDESNLTIYARLVTGSTTSVSLEGNSIAYLNAVRRAPSVELPLATRSQSEESPLRATERAEDWIDRALADAYAFVESELARNRAMAGAEVAAADDRRRPDRQRWADQWIASRYEWADQWLYGGYVWIYSEGRYKWMPGRHQWAERMREIRSAFGTYEQLFAGIEAFGITFSNENFVANMDRYREGRGNIYYQGRLVRSLIDENFRDTGGNFLTLSFISDRGGSRLDVYILRDDNGNITGLNAVEV